MNTFSWLRYLTLAAGVACAAFGQSGPQTLTSPDGRLEITFLIAAGQQATAAGGQLSFKVTYQGKALIDSSPLRLELQGHRPLGSSVRITGVTPSKTDETYRLVAGKASSVRNIYNALRVEVEEVAKPGRKLAIEARAYDDAVAFRYVVPEQAPIPEFQLINESTEFRISKDATAYTLELPNYRSMYEGEFIKRPLTGLSNQGGVPSKYLIGLPLLMELPGVAWLAITEADLKGYSSMYLENVPGQSHALLSRLAPSDNPTLAVIGALPHHSAWRVIQVASEPARLIESNVITSLNPESAIKDTSWIRPGRAAWNWWNNNLGADGKSAFTTGNMKYYVDFAANSGFEHMVLDAGWSARDDITKSGDRVNVPELARYAGSKGIKLWVWLHYTATQKQMDQAFATYESWGVAGMKIDFISRDDQAGIDFYYRVAEKAAQHHLMVDFHGATKPTGIERTWPNILGYEAVMGMEHSKFGSRDTPDNHVMLPFTRMLAGTMDYTPGGFGNVTREEFVSRDHAPQVMGTRAHHLAMYAVYQCAIQMVSDAPAAYEGQPSFEFIKKAPSTWDETRGLNGVPGEYVTVARRTGRDWFLGSMTNWTPREIEIPLTFLGKGKFRAQVYADSPDAGVNPRSVVITSIVVDRSMRLKAPMAAGGGYAVYFTPAAN